MSFQRYRRKPNFYCDSATLMQLTAGLKKQPGVRQAAALMGTPANLSALEDSGLASATAKPLDPDDVLLVVGGPDEVQLEQALDWADGELSLRTMSGRPLNIIKEPPKTIAEAVKFGPTEKISLISVPGEYAYAEALKALKSGLHVFLFSSGVTLEEEFRLKLIARDSGLLMMGAECGTALINGVPLGFANAVRRGPIGVVAASGSGLQEVTSLIHNWGGGVSHAIGTGGRDLHETIGGITMLAGMRMLAEDSSTEVIVLISKPPAVSVASSILETAASIAKPVVVCFLGDRMRRAGLAGLKFADTLEEAARTALALSGRPPVQSLSMHQDAERPVSGYVRGLFAGGTLCAEARLVLEGSLVLLSSLNSFEDLPAGNICVDLGAEEYTRGRPHPMIDASLRSEYMERALQDQNTAVVLFDIVLGFGAAADPAGPFVEVIKGSRIAEPPVMIAHVCGTEEDPQDLRKQIGSLEEVGVIVMPTNAAAAQLAAERIKR